MREKGSVDELNRKLKQFVRLFDKLDVLLSEILCMLRALGLPRAGPSGDSRPVQANRLSIAPKGDGSVLTVDDFPPLRLPRVLAALLYNLALDGGGSDENHAGDPLVPFKSYEELSFNMQKMLGKTRYSERALKQGIYRLRKLLSKRRLDALIQTDRQGKGYRFALRRTGPSLPGSVL